MEHRLSLTVIICTWQRPEALQRLLLNLALQEPPPAQILIIEGDETARGACNQPHCWICAAPRGNLRHFLTFPMLEHQRNLGADRVETPLVCFLDDDVLLEPGCLAHLVAAFADDPGVKIGGVGGFAIEVPITKRLPWRWRARRALGVVPSLTPGRYTRSGHSIPLELAPPFTGCRPVDFPTGYCMAYRSRVLEEVRFVPSTGIGEDLHFSLRVGQRYQLLHCGDARLRHFHDPTGRPSRRRYAFMSVYNRFCVQRDCLPDRRRADVCLLWYGVALDLALLLAQWTARRDRGAVTDQIAGRLRAMAFLASRGSSMAAMEAARHAFVTPRADRKIAVKAASGHEHPSQRPSSWLPRPLIASETAAPAPASNPGSIPGIAGTGAAVNASDA